MDNLLIQSLGNLNKLIKFLIFNTFAIGFFQFGEGIDIVTFLTQNTYTQIGQFGKINNSVTQ